MADPGRITEGWYASMILAGVLEDEYIEILSVATIVTCVDVFTLGMGAEQVSLPDSAEAGKLARSGLLVWQLDPAGLPPCRRRTRGLSWMTSMTMGISTFVVP